MGRPQRVEASACGERGLILPQPFPKLLQDLPGNGSQYMHVQFLRLFDGLNVTQERIVERMEFNAKRIGDSKVSTVVIGKNARSWAQRLEAIEALKCGSADAARKRLASRLGVSPGTLLSLRQAGRAKRIAADFYAKLQAHFIKGLQDEIARATHEITVARQAGLDPREAEMARLQAAVTDAQVLLNEVAK